MRIEKILGWVLVTAALWVDILFRHDFPGSPDFVVYTSYWYIYLFLCWSMVMGLFLALKRYD